MDEPDPRYFTLPPPAEVDKSTPDQALDYPHQHKFRRAVLNILSTSIAEQTLAQIVDGLPLREVARDKRFHQHRIEEPVFGHTELCPGVLDKTITFRQEFEPLTLDVPSRVLHCYQNEPVGSKASRLPFIELVAVAVHAIAAKLFKLDTSLHKEDKWPSDEYYKSNRFVRWATPFSVIYYDKPNRFPDGIADVVGYWAEDRIFGGVVLFGRGETGTGHEDVWFHSHRKDLTNRIYALEDEQIATLLRFLDSDGETLVESACPLPILGDGHNRRRIDPEIAMPEFNVFRDRWERSVNVQNHRQYREEQRCVMSPLDYPELESFETFVQTTTDN